MAKLYALPPPLTEREDDGPIGSFPPRRFGPGPDADAVAAELARAGRRDFAQTAGIVYTPDYTKQADPETAPRIPRRPQPPDRYEGIGAVVVPLAALVVVALSSLLVWAFRR